MVTELFVYGDESGIDETPYCVVAGFIASPRHWDSFNAAWRKVIEKAQVNEFHSKDFFSRRRATSSSTNPFRDWSESDASALLDALLKVIRDHPRVTPIGCALDVNIFRSYTWGERRYLTGGQWNRTTKKFITQGAPSRTYPVPFYSMVGEALQMARPAECKVNFVMDEQKVIQNGIQQVYAQYRDTELNPFCEKMGDLISGLSEEHEGIQAADLLAYTWNGWYRFRERLRRERLDVLLEIMRMQHHREMGVMRKRGLEHILTKTLLPEDRAKIRALKTHAKS